MADISEVKQDMKNGKRVLYIVLKVLSNEKIKNIFPFPFK
jgi:hypothetical protein